MGLKFTNTSFKLTGKVKIEIPTPTYSGKKSSNSTDSINPYTSTGPGISGAGINVNNINLIRNSQIIPTTGLTLRYDMDTISNNTIFDRSGNTYNSTLYNASVTTGIVNNGVYFNGTNAYAATILESTSVMTVSYWGKVGTLNSGENFGIVYINGDAYQRLACVISGSGGLGIAASFVGWHRASSNGYSGLFNDGLWHHFLFVVDKSNYLNSHVYLDGSEITYNTGSTQSFVSDNTMYINRVNSVSLSADRYGAGTIDLLRIYNRILSAAEIQVLYDEARGYL